MLNRRRTPACQPYLLFSPTDTLWKEGGDSVPSHVDPTCLSLFLLSLWTHTPGERAGHLGASCLGTSKPLGRKEGAELGGRSGRAGRQAGRQKAWRRGRRAMPGRAGSLTPRPISLFWKEEEAYLHQTTLLCLYSPKPVSPHGGGRQNGRRRAGRGRQGGLLAVATRIIHSHVQHILFNLLETCSQPLRREIYIPQEEEDMQRRTHQTPSMEMEQVWKEKGMAGWLPILYKFILLPSSCLLLSPVCLGGRRLLGGGNGVAPGDDIL